MGSKKTSTKKVAKKKVTKKRAVKPVVLSDHDKAVAGRAKVLKATAKFKKSMGRG